jgi:hypothetical protein
MSARWRECLRYSRRNSAISYNTDWKPHVENVSLDWILNTAYFSFLTFLFVIMVIALKILGFDCVNYLCVNLGIYLVTAYNFYMTISSDHVALVAEHFAKMSSLFPVPASRLSDTIQNNSGNIMFNFLTETTD